MPKLSGSLRILLTTLPEWWLSRFGSPLLPAWLILMTWMSILLMGLLMIRPASRLRRTTLLVSSLWIIWLTGLIMSVSMRMGVLRLRCRILLLLRLSCPMLLARILSMGVLLRARLSLGRIWLFLPVLGLMLLSAGTHIRLVFIESVVQLKMHPPTIINYSFILSNLFKLKSLRCLTVVISIKLCNHPISET
jgi:hypothetical protein